MIADKKLLVLSKLIPKDRIRPALNYIHIKGNKAEVTDGHIMVQCNFPKGEECFPVGTPGESDETADILVTKEQVESAFRNISKKSILPVLQNVRVSVDKEKNESIVSHTDLKNVVSFREKIVDTYPDTEQVIPEYDDSDVKTVSMGLSMLKKLVYLMKNADSDNPRIIIQFENPKSAFKFVIQDGLYKGKEGFNFIIPKDSHGVVFKGVIMPLKPNNSGEINKIMKEPYTMDEGGKP